MLSVGFLHHGNIPPMACPYFVPMQRLADNPLVESWKMPLGGVFGGECRIPGVEPWRPGEQRLRSCCNTGYAAGRCERFPVAAAADIVRWIMVDEWDGGGRLRYVFEKDHHPAGQGLIELPPPAKDDTAVAAQARSYFNSYLERKCRLPHK